MRHYAWLPVSVSPMFREQVLTKYPALEEGSDEAQVYRKLMQYCLFGTYRYDKDFDRHELILPHTLMDSFKKKNHKRKGEGALAWIKRFSRDVAPTTYSLYNRKHGRARSIDPKIERQVLDAAALEMLNWHDTGGGVEFDSGEQVSGRRSRRLLEEYQAELRASAAIRSADHPARELIDFLNDQPTETLERVLSANEQAVIDAVLEMPTATGKDRVRRHAALRVLRVTTRSKLMLYRESPRTTRIHPVGATIHQLPRALRKLALRGCISLDLKAAQLAIVSKMWGVHSLHAFLAAENDIWDELFSSLGVSPQKKPILKAAIYSITFGMEIDGVRWKLRRGVDGIRGLDKAQAAQFFEHRLIADLVTAREEAFSRLAEAGGAVDAFGRWISVDDPTTMRDLRSVLAQQVQSYEVLLMLSLLPVWQKEQNNVKVLSWLHDGVTIKYHDPRELKQQITRLQRALARRAAEFDIPTRLEWDA